MALKKKSSGGGGANWMDTYGDMVTLLLCFFVLLYSMSSISEEKYAALVMSFNPLAAQTVTESPGGEGPSADADEGGVIPEPPDSSNVTQEEIDADIQELYQAIQEYVVEQQLEQTVSVENKGGKIYITFNQAVFFDGDSSVLKKDAEPILTEVSDMLSNVASSIDEVRVLGHTAQAGNVPNRVVVDRTLASNRATNVVIFIQQHSAVDPGRLVSEGIGQWRPIAPNDSAENRAANRRVEMIVSGRDLVAEQLQGSDYPSFSIQ